MKKPQGKWTVGLLPMLIVLLLAVAVNLSAAQQGATCNALQPCKVGCCSSSGTELSLRRVGSSAPTDKTKVTAGMGRIFAEPGKRACLDPMRLLISHRCQGTCNSTAECGQYARKDKYNCPLGVCCRLVVFQSKPLQQLTSDSKHGFCGFDGDFCNDECQNKDKDECNPVR
jgi:hypothetical protein